ncbi:hypothetical protein MLD38_031617 [Melastoma candidum]|uniref:Uncharacterized protein n=1 Tax=Melastoma candidum TaxID=119954 RepID=A0ACB9MQ85_9MYRT|nr:hypothetical protein MLD38_031617 [Melastoma candidum]
MSNRVRSNRRRSSIGGGLTGSGNLRQEWVPRGLKNSPPPNAPAEVAFSGDVSLSSAQVQSEVGHAKKPHGNVGVSGNSSDVGDHGFSGTSLSNGDHGKRPHSSHGVSSGSLTNSRGSGFRGCEGRETDCRKGKAQARGGRGVAKDPNLPQLLQEIQEKLLKGTVECMICYDMVRRAAPIWSCSSCYSIFHMNCIKKWARAPTSIDLSADKNHGDNWRCPGCQHVQLTSSKEIHYMCFCGKRTGPPSDLYLTPHSCGEPCGKSLERNVVHTDKGDEDFCPHACVLPCHPGLFIVVVRFVISFTNVDDITASRKSMEDVKCGEIVVKGILNLDNGVFACGQGKRFLVVINNVAGRRTVAGIDVVNVAALSRTLSLVPLVTGTLIFALCLVARNSDAVSTCANHFVTVATALLVLKPFLQTCLVHVAKQLFPLRCLVVLLRLFVNFLALFLSLVATSPRTVAILGSVLLAQCLWQRITVTCPCRRITASVPCDAGGTNGQRKLACDEDCAKLERNKILADVFDVNTPSLEALHFGESASISNSIVDLFQREPKWVLSLEERCKHLVTGKGRVGTGSLKVHVFSPMTKEKRDAVRLIAKRWKLAINAAGWEPKRFIVIHATPKSKVPPRVLGVKGLITSSAPHPPSFDPFVDMDPRLVVCFFNLHREKDISALVLRFGGECELVWLNDKNALAVFYDPARAFTALRRLDHGSVYFGAAVIIQNGQTGSSAVGGNPSGGFESTEADGSLKCNP